MASFSDYAGGVGELFGNEFARDKQREADRIRQQGIRDAKESGEKYFDKLDTAYAGDARDYEGDRQRLRDLSTQKQLEMGDFDDSIDIASMLDPAMQFRQKQAADSISQSAANAGGMFTGSGATAKALQDRSQDIASDEWGKAYNRADSAMKGKYSRFTDKFEADKANEMRQRGYAKDLFDMSKGGRDDGLSAFGQRTDMDMTSIRDIAGIDAGIKDRDAAHAQAQWKTGSKLAGQFGDDVLASQMKGYKGGNL